MSSLLNYDEISCNERTTLVIEATLLDESGDPITAAQVDSIEMTLVETVSGSIVNSRQKQDVLNTNDCTLHATSGLFTWAVRPEDTAIVDVAAVGEIERHLATFTVTWATTETQHWEYLLKIRNLHSVPQTAP